MVRRFRGEFHQKVDGKGRVSIPADFRRVLETGDPTWTDGKSPEFVIIYGSQRQHYLECYTIEAANEVDEKIAALPRGSMDRRMLERLFNGQSVRTSVDETGRIVLPQKLRDKIDIDGQAYFMATGDTFQIWKPETFEEEEAAKAEEWLDQFDDDFDPLTLLDQKQDG